jgi:cytoskeleton protein RodZ
MSGKTSSEVVINSSPGAKLCKAREKAGISLSVLAERTLIPIIKLQALERDDFSAVGGTAHVTGYARAYGRVLAIDVNDIVKEIEGVLGVEQTRIIAEQAMGSTSTSEKTSRLYLVVVIGLIIVFAIWIGLWLFSGDSEPGSPVVPSANLSVSEKQATSTADDQSESTYGVNESTLTADDALLDEGNAVEIEETETPLPETNEPPSTQAPQTSTPELNDTGSSETGALATEVQNPLPTAAAITDVADNARDQLELSFNDDCWLNVSDATGKTLVSSLAKAGEKLELKGVAPFQVHLGNAAAAEKIAFNRQLVTFSPQSGQRTLRLTIGG